MGVGQFSVAAITPIVFDLQGMLLILEASRQVVPGLMRIRIHAFTGQSPKVALQSPARKVVRVLPSLFLISAGCGVMHAAYESVYLPPLYFFCAALAYRCSVPHASLKPTNGIVFLLLDMSIVASCNTISMVPSFL